MLAKPKVIEAPETVVSPKGTPYECPVTDALFARVELAGDGVWSHTLANEKRVASATASPWPGGTDGWISKQQPRLDQEQS